MKNKKAVISQIMVFIILSILIVLIFGILAPWGAMFSVAGYTAGESILNQSYEAAGNIQNEGVKTELRGSITGATTETSTNIQMFTGMYKYAWLFFIIILGLAIFLYTRRSVEMGYGGFV